MRGTILDFLKLASEKPDLAKELVELATRHDFEFSNELGDEELEAVSGGAAFFSQFAARIAQLSDSDAAKYQAAQPFTPGAAEGQTSSGVDAGSTDSEAGLLGH